MHFTPVLTQIVNAVGIWQILRKSSNAGESTLCITGSQAVCFCMASVYCRLCKHTWNVCVALVVMPQDMTTASGTVYS